MGQDTCRANGTCAMGRFSLRRPDLSVVRLHLRGLARIFGEPPGRARGTGRDDATYPRANAAPLYFWCALQRWDRAWSRECALVGSIAAYRNRLLWSGTTLRLVQATRSRGRLHCHPAWLLGAARVSSCARVRCGEFPG